MPSADTHVVIKNKVTLYKRPQSPNYQVRIKLDTKWRSHSTGTDNLEEAKLFALSKLSRLEILKDEGVITDKPIFRTIANETITILEKTRDTDLWKKVYADYIWVIKKWLIPFFGNMAIDNIKQGDLEVFDTFRENESGKVPAKSTISTHNSALKRVFKTAIGKRIIQPNQKPEFFNNGAKPNIKQTFEIDEWNTMWSHALYHWIDPFKNKNKNGKDDGIRGKRQQQTIDLRQLTYDYMMIVSNSGIRPGTESIGIKWKHVTIVKSISGKLNLTLFVSGKTGSRKVFPRKAVTRALERIQSGFPELVEYELGHMKDVNEYVFRLPNSSTITAKSFNKQFQKLLSACDILYDNDGNKRTAYSLRHFYATQRIMSGGIDLAKLAKAMGTSVTMLERHYSHLETYMIADELVGDLDKERNQNITN